MQFAKEMQDGCEDRASTTYRVLSLRVRRRLGKLLAHSVPVSQCRVKLSMTPRTREPLSVGHHLAGRWAPPTPAVVACTACASCSGPAVDNTHRTFLWLTVVSSCEVTTAAAVAKERMLSRQLAQSFLKTTVVSSARIATGSTGYP
jgi:hypothetical protein